MGPVTSVRIVLLLCVVSIVIGESGTSLRVLESNRRIYSTLRLTCKGMSPHPLAGVSWLLTNASQEKQMASSEDGSLYLMQTPELNGARVACRSHSRPQRRLAVAAPAFEISLDGAPPPTQTTNFRQVVLRIGNNTTFAEGGQVHGVNGSEIEIHCEGRNLPKSKLYIYILQRNGDIENELAGAEQVNARLAQASVNLTLNEIDHLSEVFCLARWFGTERYEAALSVRSEPVVLLIRSEPEPILNNMYLYPYLWIAVGVGGLGWLIAVLLLGVVCRRKRANVKHSDSTEVITHESKIQACGMRANSTIYSEPVGATVVSNENARSLLTANKKLSPLAEPPPKALDDEATYANLQELNALMVIPHSI